jgi:hypothetical protein
MIQHRQAELEAFHRLAFPDPKPEPKAAAMPVKTVNLSDADLIEKARQSNPKLARLWAGDRTDYIDADHPAGNPSSADAGFCEIAAWWTGKDAGRIDAWVRASGLMRPKWERADYRDSTIAYGISKCSGQYDPAYRSDAPDLADALQDGPLAAVEEAERIVSDAVDCSEHAAEIALLQAALATCHQAGLTYKRQLDGVRAVLRNKHLTPGLQVHGIATIFLLDEKERRAPGQKHTLYRAAVAERAGSSESTAGNNLEKLASTVGIIEKDKPIYRTFQELDRKTGEITERKRRICEFLPRHTDPAAALRALASYAPPTTEVKPAWGGVRVPQCKDHPKAGVNHFESFRCKACNTLLAGNEYVPADTEGDALPLYKQVAPIEPQACDVVNEYEHLAPIGDSEPLNGGVAHIEPVPEEPAWFQEAWAAHRRDPIAEQQAREALYRQKYDRASPRPAAATVEPAWLKDSDAWTRLRYQQNGGA